MPDRGPGGLSRRSERFFAWFRWYARRYVARRFHAVRLARVGFRPGQDLPAGPIIVVMNHPSWWDPMLGLVLSDLFPGRRHAAPMEAKALTKYRFFERLGFFGIEPGTVRGAREFLTRGLAVLADADAMLWVTAQGRFADVRERPLRLREGIGHLAQRLSTGSVLPLALEYGFWRESTPEAFASFGPPIALGGDHTRKPGAWTAHIAAALEQVQDALAADVARRDPSRFETLLAGGAGVGGVYDLGRRLRAALCGEPFSAAHGDEHHA